MPFPTELASIAGVLCGVALLATTAVILKRKREMTSVAAQDPSKCADSHCVSINIGGNNREPSTSIIHDKIQQFDFISQRQSKFTSAKTSLAGVLRIKIHEARNLTNREEQFLGISDPYAVVKFEGQIVARTKTVQNSLNPYWGQVFYLPIPSEGSENADIVSLEIYDKNHMRKDVLIGKVSQPLNLRKWISSDEHDQSAASQQSSSRELLVSSWGSPWNEEEAESDDDTWHRLIDDSNSMAGEIRVTAAYQRLEILASGKNLQPAENIDSTLPSRPHSRYFSETHLKREDSLSKFSGVLTVGVEEGTFKMAELDRNLQYECIASTRPHCDESGPFLVSKGFLVNGDTVDWEPTLAHLYVANNTDTNVAIEIRHPGGKSILGSLELSVLSVIQRLANLLLKKSEGSQLQHWYTLETRIGKIELKLTVLWHFVSPAHLKPSALKCPPESQKVSGNSSKTLVSEIPQSRSARGPIGIMKIKVTKSHGDKTKCLSPGSYFRASIGSGGRRVGTVDFPVSTVLNISENKEFNDEELRKDGITSHAIGNLIQISIHTANASNKPIYLLLSFELEFYPADTSSKIEALSSNERNFIAENREKLLSEISEVRELEEKGIATQAQAALKIQQITEKRFNSDELDLLMRPGLKEISPLSNMPAKPVVQISVDDTAQFTSIGHATAGSKDEKWSVSASICVVDVKSQIVGFQIKNATGLGAHGDAAQSNDPSVFGKWHGTLKSIVGKKDKEIQLESEESTMRLKLNISVSYHPVPMATQELQKIYESGMLIVNLENAVNIDGLDKGGTSDPYVVAFINGIQVHKSRTVMKTCNPSFNEWFHRSMGRGERQGSVLRLDIVDFNAIGRHAPIGSVEVSLWEFEADRTLQFAQRVRGAHSGSLQFRLRFFKGDPKQLEGKMQLLQNLVSESTVGGVPARSAGSGAASPDIRGTVEMTVVEARGLRPVDANGLADPFVKVMQTVHGHARELLKTNCIHRTLTPHWDERVAVVIPPSDVLLVVRDKNTLGASKPLGEARVDLGALVSAGGGNFDAWVDIGHGQVRVRGRLI
ncbi:Arf guanine nucleotide exchange factor syt1 [Entophlyctis luteolus]|nr:Arf guanine nucleotide exchange factor syt1 [Entophlyctis luteolus]